MTIALEHISGDRPAEPQLQLVLVITFSFHFSEVATWHWEWRVKQYQMHRLLPHPT